MMLLEMVFGRGVAVAVVASYKPAEANLCMKILGNNARREINSRAPSHDFPIHHIAIEKDSARGKSERDMQKLTY